MFKLITTTVVPHHGQHLDCNDTCDQDPQEHEVTVGHQDQGVHWQDQQPGLVWKEPPQEQHRGGGSDGAVQAPGRDRFTNGHRVCMLGLHQVCIKFASYNCSMHANFMLGMVFGPNFMLGLDKLHKVCSGFASKP